MDLTIEQKAKILDYLIENHMDCAVSDDKMVWLTCSTILRNRVHGENYGTKLDVLEELDRYIQSKGLDLS